MQADNHTLALAQQLADAAGDIIRRYWRVAVPIDSKADASPVTRADREAETAMRALIETHFPDHGIIGEEFGNVRRESPYQWVLDPIDGTRSFIAGYPIFTTLIALAHDGIPILGIIDQPITSERWTGITGEATTLHKKKITTRQCYTLDHATIATTSTDYFTPAQAEIYARFKTQCANRLLGGDAYAYAMLASGQIDIVVDAGMKAYDFCALKPVIEGAGGIITDWNGKPLTIHSNGNVIAAANHELHQQALKTLSAA